MEEIGERHGQGSPPPIGTVAEQFAEIIVKGFG